jgi:hypothetical protein
MKTSIQVDILNPKVLKLLYDLADLNLITISKKTQPTLKDVLKELRSKSAVAPDLTEITEEVEKVRAKRNGKGLS